MEVNQNKWICFFSQTGGEIADLSEKLGRYPDLIITNNRPSHLRTIDKRLWGKVYYLPNTPTVEDYEKFLSNYVSPLVTLHGWLRVVPKEICERYTIFNGHPGLITKFKELKGKDPQIRTFNGHYPIAGSVLHKVTPAVDEGEIISSKEFSTNRLDLDGLFLKLKDSSLELWVDFLKDKVQ
jgi:folate-dependent phosphoribosylglycinamide formyltransferase PurN